MRGNYKSPKFSRSAASRQSPDGVGSGKSNLWSLEAREDIYSRRHNGEEWETICKDYPSRTRHAMQQQYSVMRKQNAADNPSHTPSRRGGRRRRGVARGNKWATVNQPRPDSSEEDSDSVQPLELELDDDDDDEYEGIPPPAESDVPDEDEPVIQEAVPSPSPPSALIGKAQESSRRPGTTKGPRRLSAPKEPRRPSTSKSALFPNLHSRSVDQVEPPSLNTDPGPVNPDPKLAQGGLSKRRADAEGSDSESRSSSHLSKRRKYSTEPSETFNVLPADSAASLKLLDSFKLPGVFLHPDVIAKAMEDWKTMSAAYESEKMSRKETYEAALKRATRRANDAEHKLQDASQQYANNLKAEKEAQAKALEAKDKLLEAKDKLLEAKDKALEVNVRELEAKETAFEAKEKAFEALKIELEAEKENSKGTATLTILTSQLSEKESQLKLYDALRAQIDSQVSALKALQTTALEKSEDVKAQHATLTAIIDAFGAEDFDDMGMVKFLGTVKKYSKDICEGNRRMVEKLETARGTWRRTSEAVGAFHAQFGGESKGIEES